MTHTFPLNNYDDFRVMFFKHKNRSTKSPLNPFYVGKIICTYAIECKTSGKAYVGSTSNFRERWGHHRNRLNYGNHVNILLSREVDLYGIDDFTIRILNTYETTDGLLKHEQRDAFSHFKESVLLNGCIGGRVNFEYPRQHFNRPSTMNPGRNQKVRWIKGETA